MHKRSLVYTQEILLCIHNKCINVTSVAMLRSYAKLCETMQNYAKLRETIRNYAKLCETTRNSAVQGPGPAQPWPLALDHHDQDDDDYVVTT